MQSPIHHMRAPRTPSFAARASRVFAGVAAASFSVAFLPIAAGGGGPLPPVGSPGGPSRALDPAEAEQWLRGRAVFDKAFHKSDGLGLPELNADSCRACHEDPVLGGAGGLELNVSRFGFDNGGAGPFQDVAGGQGLSKFYPAYVPGREEYDPATADVFEQRQTPTTFGLGFIDHIPESEILANEDPTDSDMDGIFGVARIIDVNGTDEVGRFGWKSQIPRLADFIRDAMGNECGITTQDVGRGFAVASDGDAVPDPELSPADFADIRFFMGHLAAPQRKGSTAPEVGIGEALFTSIGCAKCHIPTLMDDQGQPVDLYSNLLLHNVMPPSFRGMAEPGAGVGFYRTPPLWGIVDTPPYMHDGRAETLRDAIQMHNGEAIGVRNAFLGLSATDKDALIAFLEDL